MSGVTKFYPAVVIYDEGIANHAVRLHLQSKMSEWFQTHNLDYSRVGHVLLFTIRDMEYFELLAHKIGAEKLMTNYIDFVEKEPRNPDSMFHDYVLDRYPQAKEPTGLTHETTERVLKAVQAEMEQRKRLQPRDQETESGRIK